MNIGFLDKGNGKCKRLKMCLLGTIRTQQGDLQLETLARISLRSEQTELNSDRGWQGQDHCRSWWSW